MKGVVLAGGTGSRLFPLTKVTNKHLLPVGHYPMIFHPIAKLADAGITDILIVTGTDHMGDVVRVLGSGADLGLEFTYRVQEEAGGIAQALGLAEGFAAGGPSVVILGDNVLEDNIALYVAEFDADPTGATLLLNRVPDPERFGVAEISGDRIVSIEEKPTRPKGEFAVTGIYMYDADVFDIIRGLQPSGRGELEITDVNNAYLARSSLRFRVLDGWWSDAGTPRSYRHANELARRVVLDLFERTGTHAAVPRDG